MKKFKFTIRGQKYDVEIQKFEDNLAEIEVNGTVYHVEVEQETKTSKTPRLVRPDLPPPSRRDTKIRKNISSSYPIKAPLPGNILQVMVKEGDEVKKGDKLLTYEAMKMENTVTAEKDGTIKKVKVAPGDSVLQDDILIELS